MDEDEPLFLSLINDLFPGLQLDSSTYVELQAAVSNQVNLEGLINHPPWNLKLVQVRATVADLTPWDLLHVRVDAEPMPDSHRCKKNPQGGHVCFWKECICPAFMKPSSHLV